MKRLEAYYDRLARKYSLNWAIVMIALYAFYSCLGLFVFFKYFQQHDGFYLFVGPLNLVIGIFGVFQGAGIMHAVVRRLMAESRQTAQS